MRRKVSWKAPRREHMLRVCEAEDLHEHVQVFGEPHLRLHDTQVASDVAQKSWLATGGHSVDVLAPRFVVGGLRDVE